MGTSRITLTRLDGSEIAFDTRTFMCLADRVAFERHFQSSSAAMTALKDKFDDSGKPLPGADLSDLREEHLAFLVWLAAVRSNDSGVVGPFEDFVMDLEDFDVKEDAEADPTEAPSEPSPRSLSSLG